MKAVIAAVAVAVCLAFATPAHAWNCTTPGAIRVQVPNGTTGTGTGDGLGQVVVDSGLTFECEILPPTTPPTTNPSSSTSTSSANSAANSASNSASNSSASSNQNQSQKQRQTQTANGGQATATGGQGGAGGSASVGNVSSTSSVSKSGNSTLKNVGNSSNSNTNSATGGNQSQSSTATAQGNGDNSNNYENVTNVPRDTATAVAPTVLPTVPCFKGIGAGIQGPAFGASFGGGKIDANCAELEASRLAPSLIARCKVYLENKYVKQAGVTMADCMTVPVPASVIVQAPIPVPAPIINVTVPPAVVTVVAAPAPPAPNVAVAAHVNATVHHVAHPACKCVYTNEGPVKKNS